MEYEKFNKTKLAIHGQPSECRDADAARQAADEAQGQLEQEAERHEAEARERRDELAACKAALKTSETHAAESADKAAKAKASAEYAPSGVAMHVHMHVHMHAGDSPWDILLFSGGFPHCYLECTKYMHGDSRGGNVP